MTGVELEELQEAARPRDGPADVRVEWRDADLKERPDGMPWRPATDEDPALFAFDLGSAAGLSF